MLETTHRTDPVGDPRNAPVMNWVPDSSNCPDLQEYMHWVISRLPSGNGQNTARQVFVGRIPTARPEAMTWAHGPAAGIEITLQFSNVISMHISTRSGGSLTRCPKEPRHS